MNDTTVATPDEIDDAYTHHYNQLTRERLLEAYRPFYHSEARDYTLATDTYLRSALRESYKNLTKDTEDLFSYTDEFNTPHEFTGLVGEK